MIWVHAITLTMEFLIRLLKYLETKDCKQSKIQYVHDFRKELKKAGETGKTDEINKMFGDVISNK